MTQAVKEKEDTETESVPKSEKGEETFSPDEIEKLEKNLLARYARRDTERPIGTLLRLYRPYYNRLLLALLFYLIKYTPVIVVPMQLSAIVTAVVEGTDVLRTIIVSSSIAVFTLLINIPFNLLYIKYKNYALRYMEAGLRGAIVRKLQHLTISFNKEMQSGRIQSKILNDVGGVQNLAGTLMNSGLEMVASFASIFTVMLCKLHWQMMAFFLVSGLIIYFSTVFFRKRIRQSYHDLRIVSEQTSAKVADTVQMIPVTRAHGLGETENRSMSKQVSRLAHVGFRVDKISGLYGSVVWVIMQFMQLSCLVFAALMALIGVISIGDVTMYQSYYGLFIGYIGFLVNLIPTIASGSESINSVGEILDSNDVEHNEGKPAVEKVRGDLVFDNVHFCYEDKKEVLTGFNFHIHEGETVAFVGESGAGKSTILNLITGFYQPSRGRVLLDGTDLATLDLNSYRTHIAVVPQSSTLFMGTVRDNITYGSPDVTEEELQKAVEAACLTDVIASLPKGLDTVIGEHGDKLSGGQKQRISIARAIIRNPKIIIFDEATSALDTVSEKHIQTAISNLAKGRTTLIVAHRLSTVKDADRIVVLKDGVCEESGTFDELVAMKGEFYRFRNMQI